MRKKLSTWRKKMIELSLRAKLEKKGSYIWLSHGKTGLGLTYERSKHGELKHV